MQSSALSRRPLVGIDLGPIEQATRAAGTARLVEEQARALARLDVPWEWQPVTETDANPLRELFAPARAIAGGGRRVSVRNSFWTGPAWRRAGCDLAFATNGLVPWFGGPRLVSNFFDASIFDFGATWIRTGRLKAYLILRTLTLLTLRRSERLFILSNYGRERMASLYPRYAAKFVVVPCGLSALSAPCAQPPAWAAGLQKPFVLNVGVFSDNKNQARLIEAWASLQADPQAPELVLVGAGDAAYLDAHIRPAIARLPRPAEVRLAGRVPDAELAWAYAHALTYVQPSFAEGFGLPLLEAMAAGCAIASSRSTSLPETAGDAAVFFDPASPRDIAAAVRRLAGDAALRQSLIGLGRERAQLFTWERNAQLIAAEIEQVLGRPSAPPAGPKPAAI